MRCVAVPDHLRGRSTHLAPCFPEEPQIRYGRFHRAGPLVLVLWLLPALLGMGGQEEFNRRGPFAGARDVGLSAEVVTVGTSSSASPAGESLRSSDYDQGDQSLVPSAATLLGAANNDVMQSDMVVGDFNGDGVDEAVLAQVSNDVAGALVVRVLAVVDGTLQFRGEFDSTGETPFVPYVSAVENPNPWTINDEGGDVSTLLGARVARPNRSLRLAVGQLDDDPEHEVVLAYIDSSYIIQLRVLNIDENLNVSDPVTRPPSATFIPLFNQNEAMEPGDSPDLQHTNSVIEVATGDFDGDLVDEIALITPSSSRPLSLVDPVRGTHFDHRLWVYLFELVEVEGQTQIAARGEFGAIDAFAPTNDATLLHFLSALEARSAHLDTLNQGMPGTGGFVGAPRDSLVVGLQSVGRDGQPPFAVGEIIQSGFLTMRFERCSADPDSDFCIPETLPPAFSPGLTEYTTFQRAFTGVSVEDPVGTRYPIPHTAFCLEVGNLDDDTFDEVAVYHNDRLTLWQIGTMQALEGQDVAFRHANAGTVNVNSMTGLVSGQAAGLIVGNLVETRVNNCTMSIADVHAADLPDGSDAELFLPDVIVDYYFRETAERSIGGIERSWRVTQDHYRPSGGTIILEDSVVVDEGINEQGLMGGLWRSRRSRSVAGDFDGDRIRLGEPQEVQRLSSIQPLIYLGAPPTHFDVLAGSGETYDPTGCYADSMISENCSDWPITYLKEVTMGMEASVQVESAFEASAEGSVGLGDFKVGLEARYGRNFSTTNGTTQTFDFVEDRSAVARDQLYGLEMSYDFWEYPVIDDGVATGDSISVIVPQPSLGVFTTFDCAECAEIVPRHEPGNLLSYLTLSDFEDMLAFRANPPSQLVEVVRGSGQTITKAVQAFFSLVVGSATETQRGAGTTVGASLEASVGASYGVVNVGFEVSAAYDKGTLATTTTTVTESQEIRGDFGEVEFDNDQYRVVPFVLFDGPVLIVDYAVDFNAGSTTFLNHYGALPDPALNLPRRFYFEKGIVPSPDDPRRLESKSILFSPTRPDRGDVVTLAARVYNMSLQTLPTDVTVNFYDTDPIASPSAVPIASAVLPGPMRPQSMQPALASWIVPMNAPPSTKIYAEVEPAPGQAEIRSDNNVGWRELVLVPEPRAAAMGISAAIALAALARLRRRGAPPL